MLLIIDFSGTCNPYISRAASKDSPRGSGDPERPEPVAPDGDGMRQRHYRQNNDCTLTPKFQKVKVDAMKSLSYSYV